MQHTKCYTRRCVCLLLLPAAETDCLRDSQTESGTAERIDEAIKAYKVWKEEQKLAVKSAKSVNLTQLQ